jgi:2-polyprenyl-3-methyl-5-hydroxy-6-metoxy-1,4-benzoquinol methylase
MMASKAPGADLKKAKDVAEQVMADVSGMALGALCFIGDRLGLFKAMGDGSELTVAQLAARCEIKPRYAREWLDAMVAAGYAQYRPAERTYWLTPEYAMVLADENSPLFVGGYFALVQGAASVATKVAEAFKNGGGVDQKEYPPWFYEAVERNSRVRYRHKLLSKWLAALPGASAALQAGGLVADVGCGGGHAAIVIAQGFAKARVIGYDVHAPSLERARQNAAAAGVSDRVSFELDDGSHLPAATFDLVTTFDVVHDSVDPLGLLRAIRRALKPQGIYLMQEIKLSGEPQDNVGRLGKIGYSMSTLYCMTTSLAHDGAGIGVAMGEVKARELATAAGFGVFNHLPVEDDFAVLYELRP